MYVFLVFSTENVSGFKSTQYSFLNNVLWSISVATDHQLKCKG